jgi:hypothetical protein
MGQAYVSVKREVRHRSFHPVVLFLIALGLFVSLSLFMRGEYNGLRDEYINQLRREREMTDANNRLKMELTVITRGRYIELKANERLGLKKPREEEVLVLR